MSFSWTTKSSSEEVEQYLVDGLAHTSAAVPPPIRPRTRKVRVHRKGKLPRYLRTQEAAGETSAVDHTQDTSNTIPPAVRTDPSTGYKSTYENEDTIKYQTVIPAENSMEEKPTLSSENARRVVPSSETYPGHRLHEKAVTSPPTEDKTEEEELEQRRARLIAARRNRASSSESDSDDDLEVARNAKPMGTENEVSGVLRSQHQYDMQEAPASKPSTEPTALEESGSSDEGSESSDSDSSSSSSSDDEILPPVPLVAPKFISRAQRQTLRDEEKRLESEEAKQAQAELELEERKKVTRKMNADVVEHDYQLKMKRKLMKKQNGLGGSIMVSNFANRPDDTDHPDDEAELNAWKARELNRSKRDIERKEKEDIERRERERRANMTEEETIAENEKLIELGLKKGKKDKEQRGFLQRYYHKGVFFMDDDTIARDEAKSTKPDVRRGDFSQPTLEDKFDKSAMPKAMQVKNFGRSGRSKWTHLSNEDTTNLKDNMWANAAFRNPIEKTQAGSKRKR